MKHCFFPSYSVKAAWPINEYFFPIDFFRSNTAERMKLDNYPDDDSLWYNFIRLLKFYLIPLREKYGKPIRISSGYRCEALNCLVGGAVRSRHTTGCAVDLVADDLDSLFDIVKDLDSRNFKLHNPHLCECLIHKGHLHIAISPRF